MEDPLSYGKSRSIKKFKTKYTEELNNKDLPSNQRKKILELCNSEYAKLFMMGNPIHDNDREKASSITQNIKYNENVTKTNPYFKKMKIIENSFEMSQKEMYRYCFEVMSEFSIGQFSELDMFTNPYKNQTDVMKLVKRIRADRKLKSNVIYVNNLNA
jgi:hypothetical protein